jgi:hypothetical protein
MNIFVTNAGKSSAFQFRHQGAAMVAVPGQMQEFLLEATFYALRRQIESAGPAPKQDVAVGQSDLWFTVPGPAIDEALKASLDNGSQVIYVLNLMQYKDNLISGKRNIYTESCGYLIKGVIHFCESGHNTSYISQ